MKKILVLGALSLFCLSDAGAVLSARKSTWPLRVSENNIGLWKVIEIENERDESNVEQVSVGSAIEAEATGHAGQATPATRVALQDISPHMVTGEERHFELRGLNKEETLSALSAIAEKNNGIISLRLHSCCLDERSAQKLIEIIQKNPNLETFDCVDIDLKYFGFTDGYLSENDARRIFDELFHHQKIQVVYVYPTIVTPECCRLWWDFDKMLANINTLNTEWQRLLKIAHSDWNLERLEDDFSRLVRDIRATRDFAEAGNIKEQIRAFMNELPEDKMMDGLKVAFENILKLGSSYFGYTQRQ